MIVQQVWHNSKEYWQLVTLRDQILRKPLGLKFSKEELALENSQWHYGIFIEGIPVACMVFAPMSEGKIKMRQVCTTFNVQGKGIGKTLLQYCENDVQQRGYKEIICHARAASKAFYLKNDYEVIGDAFEEIGIAHYFMRKRF